MLRRIGSLVAFAILFAAAVGRLAPRGDAADGEGPLPRRSYLGVQVGPVPAPAREAAKLAEGEGVAVLGTLPDSAAEAAGLKPGDLIVAIAGQDVEGPAGFVAAASRASVGARLSLKVVREGEPIAIDLVPGERPREQSDEFRVEYGEIDSQGDRLRTVITRPKGEGKFPALLLIPGLGCFSQDAGLSADAPYKSLIDEFTRDGFVTLRVEKPGCGDSEGGPCPDVDFDTELDAYRQALKALKALDYVDADRVVIFGHSMGGVFGPIVAAENDVRGIAVYGTVVKTFFEYALENFRRQLLLTGADPADVDRRMRLESAFYSRVLLGKQTPAEAVAAAPDLAEVAEDVAPDGLHLFGRHIAFFHQLQGRNLPGSWQQTDAHVLALWGECDFVSTRDDHEQIAAIVEADRPGRGEFRALPNTDHGFDRADSPADSQARGPAPGEPNPAFSEALRAWAKRIVVD